MNATATGYHVRWMIRKDTPVCAGIDNACFGTQFWEETEFAFQLKLKNVIGLVAEDSAERVTGFCVYELQKSYLQIMRIATMPGSQGAGRALVDKIKSRLPLTRRHKIIVDVPELRLHAQLAFRAMGFRAVGILGASDGSAAYTDYRMEFSNG